MLSTRNVCGTAGCSCHADPARRHGPYWQYTRKVSGKTVTRRLSAAQAALYAEWIGNGRALGDLLAQMQQVSDKARDLILATFQTPEASPLITGKTQPRSAERQSSGCTRGRVARRPDSDCRVCLR